MDATHLHLLTNHIPILGSLFGFLLLLTGMLMKNRTVEIVALATILLSAVFTLPTYFSGEEAEHVIEKIQGISEFQLEEHEEHAELSLWMMMVSGILALMALVSYFYAKHLTRITRIATLIVTAIAFATLVPLALHGGKIVHSELRSGDAPSVEAQADHEDHDD
ncbi:MAG: hypothetical protein HQ500_12150 [Flavobacteriales bacterium]|nr:hypothetical protein [Flavobacteriales bacterium]